MCVCVCVCECMQLISKWEWPNALHLLPQQNDPNMTLPVYDPNSHRDSAAVMPIITPVYPAMNSTYNVTRCTMVGLTSLSEPVCDARFGSAEKHSPRRYRRLAPSTSVWI